jgi:hypothetical protein
MAGVKNGAKRLECALAVCKDLAGAFAFLVARRREKAGASSTHSKRWRAFRSPPPFGTRGSARDLRF